ncbi:hypothetical protein [Rhizobium mongolense]
MRRDRPGYQFRRNSDGSVAHYWNPIRASRQHGASAFRLRLPDGLTDDEIAEHCQRLTTELREGQNPESQRQRKRRNIAGQLFKMYRKRAREIGKPFDLSEEWIHDQLCHVSDKCEISGVDFNYDPQPRATKKHFKQPSRPSLDRIDNTDGYIPGNIRIVLHCVNIGINEWGLDNYIAVCKAVASHERSIFPDLSSPHGKLLISTDW